ncbi:phosphatase PAP2 family protein [Streptomyces sp. NPDC000229]|uniref:phosphatase PAP2 family protein n=1 Tax=Streptomyces sp. NPDC000229 TaxID=3154247 RepID=UPI004037C6F8
MRYVGADRSLLSALHAYGRRRPAVAATARTLSYAGEHGALWLAAGLVGAAADRPRRGPWLRATALTATAHLAGMALKRLVRRPRPSAGSRTPPDRHPADGNRRGTPVAVGGTPPAVSTGGSHGTPSGTNDSCCGAPLSGPEPGPGSGCCGAPVSGPEPGPGSGCCGAPPSGTGDRGAPVAVSVTGAGAESPPDDGCCGAPVSGEARPGSGCCGAPVRSGARDGRGAVAAPAAVDVDVDVDVDGGGTRARRTPFRPVVGRYSFPSSHAASAVAAAVAFAAVRPGARWVAGPVAAAMCLSRPVVGVHYPTDVVAGALLGAVTATVGGRWTPPPVKDRFFGGRRG